MPLVKSSGLVTPTKFLPVLQDQIGNVALHRGLGFGAGFSVGPLDLKVHSEGLVVQGMGEDGFDCPATVGVFCDCGGGVVFGGRSLRSRGLAEVSTTATTTETEPRDSYQVPAPEGEWPQQLQSHPDRWGSCLHNSPPCQKAHKTKRCQRAESSLLSLSATPALDMFAMFEGGGCLGVTLMQCDIARDV